MPDVTIRVQPLTGTWETIGTDRATGIWPENVTLSSDQWGSSQASFDLRRDPGSGWPDLEAFTPIEIEVGGLLAWSGRVKETPTRDGAERVINVQCEGWQYHLDDDMYAHSYVWTDMSAFMDMRSVQDAPLGPDALLAAGQVSTGSGILLSYPTGTNQVPGMQVGCVLDLGGNSRAERVTVTWEAWNNGGSGVTATHKFFIRGSDIMRNNQGAGQYDDAWADGTLVGPTTTTASFDRPYRYIQFFLLYAGPANVVGTTDVFARITDLKIYGQAAWESGDQSNLTATDVIIDAMTYTPMLNTFDRSRITNTTFKIPSLTSPQPQTVRQWIDAVNAYHGYLTAVDVDRRIVFQPLPSTPEWEINTNTGGVTFDDAATTSGADIYNRVWVQAQSPNGKAITTRRISAAPGDLNTTNLVARRGFTRTMMLPVSSPLPEDEIAASQIGDIWLGEHQTTPFRGSLTLTGSDALRGVTTGTTVPLARLLTAPRALLRFSDRADPDTGGWGRDGRIASVTYTPATDTAQVAIDSTRANLENLLARLAVVSGG